MEFHVNIIQRALIPTQITAGVTAPDLDDAGKPLKDDEDKPVLTAKYPGLHALRHFYASWCITGKRTAAWSCPPRSCNTGLGTRRLPSRSIHMVTCFRAAMTAPNWQTFPATNVADAQSPGYFGSEPPPPRHRERCLPLGSLRFRLLPYCCR